MNHKYSLRGSSLGSLFVVYCLTIYSANGQIIPDKNLPNNSTIKRENNTIFIEGGTQVGTNLFHSFKDFSIPTNSIGYFNNALSVQNIISRVTGKSVSNIDGILKANGTANLFLINPNGIIFSTNARLNIGGSFLGSTASSINFANGFKFSATNPQTEALLTISTPVELQLGDNPGIIKVQGSGHTLTSSDVYSPIDTSKFPNGLRVKSGNTLALIGGDILLDGGILMTENGRIELESVDQGKINLAQKLTGWIFSPEQNQSLRNITLSNNALVSAGSNDGTTNIINIQGREIKVLNGSLIFSQNFSQYNNYQSNRGIIMNASDILKVQGSSQFISSGIFTSNFGKTIGDNIQIATNQIDIEGAQIATTTFNNASSGTITLNTNDLKITGTLPSPVNPSGYGGINTLSYSSGNGGDIIGTVKNLILENKGTLATISTSNLTGQSGNFNIISETITIKNGSSLGSLTFSKGNGGNVFVNASKYIKVIGQASTLEPSVIQSTSFNSGNAGNLEINTPVLSVKDGATINTSTLSSGDAGNLIINAPVSIEVSGVNSNSKQPSAIGSSAAIASESLKIRYGLLQDTTGSAANLTLNTKNLTVTNNALVTVKNDGSGDAGKLQINANRVNITNNAGIVAITAVGQGGDIGINSKAVYLQNGYISATAGTQGTNGDGGNIIVNTDILAALGNSTITANAYKGRGGNININAQGFFASRNSQFTASSELGINGTVQFHISNDNIVPSKAVSETIQLAPEITSACQRGAGTTASKFVIIGTGSAPRNLATQASNNSGWHANSARFTADNNLEKPSLQNLKIQPIVEAQSVLIEPSGEVNLLASPNQVTAVASASSESSCFTTGSKSTPVSTFFP